MAKNQMKAECITAVSAVMGRELSPNESSKIVEDMRVLFVKHKLADPSKTRQEIVVLAAQDYANILVKEAKRKQDNAKKQALLVYKNRTAYQNYRDQGLTPNQTARRILDKVDKISNGVKEQYKSKLVDMLEKTAPRFLGLVENTKMIKDMLNEIAGKDTGNAEAKKAAEAWLKVTEEMRDRFNRAGGNIGKLEDWLFPQTHDRYKIINAARRLNDNSVVSAGKAIKERVGLRKHDIAENREAWVNFVFDRIDKKKYLDNDMRQMTDDQIRDVLRTCYTTITQNGANKLSIFKVTGGHGKSKAETRSEHRTIHFKDADARFEYNSVFGQNPSVLGTMMSHVGQMANDIALMEEMGPSPTKTFSTIKRMAQVENDKNSPSSGHEISSQNKLLENMWSNLTGNANVIENSVVAGVGQAARSLQVAGKLGSAFISSFTDVATYFHTAHVNKMPFFQSAKFLVKSLNPLDKSDKKFMARAGIIGDELNSAASRFVADNMSYGVTGKLADLTLRLSLLSQWTDSVRRAQSLNTMASFADITKNHDWNSIDGWLKARLENFGIDETMWKIFRECQPETFKGSEFLTINSIRNMSDASKQKLKITDGQLDRAISTYLGFVMDDSFMASLQPDLYTRAIQNGGFPKGTIAGELWRSAMLFKSFPIAMMTRHFQRSGDLYRYKKSVEGTASAVASRVGYMSSLIISTTLVAYVANMFKDLINGSDIKDPTSLDAFKRAVTAGGGMGFVGDILVSGMDDYKYGHPALMNMAGPVLSTAMDAYTIFDKFKDNKDVSANMIRIAKGNLPLVNLWYTKQLLNHAVFNQLQEMMNPGYHARIERKIMKNQGVGFWWKPTEMTPRRAPRIGVQPDK